MTRSLSSRRKQEVMGPQNLFTLLTDRLLLNCSHLSMITYNALYEVSSCFSH